MKEEYIIKANNIIGEDEEVARLAASENNSERSISSDFIPRSSNSSEGFEYYQGFISISDEEGNVSGNVTDGENILGEMQEEPNGDLSADSNIYIDNMLVGGFFDRNYVAQENTDEILAQQFQVEEWALSHLLQSI